jgi:DNA-directed RNA polymerase specialized sigma24 family protein
MGDPPPATAARLDQPHLDEVIARCREERSAYRSTGARTSPWCMELFRRAFVQNQDAWAALQATFEPLVRAWIGKQQLVEHDDILQETFLAFAHYAPNHPDLVAGDEPDRVLGFLRRCAKTALLTLLRHYHDEDELNEQVVAAPTTDDAEIRATIRERLGQLLETEEERRAFYLRFECGLKPQQIVALYSQQFPDLAILYDIVQRITRRLRKDSSIRGLYGLPPIVRQKPGADASLEIHILAGDEDDSMPNTPCGLNEGLLLDYITGAASPDVRLTIERSPECLAAARRLARELRPLLRSLYRMSCPDAPTLVAYQERRLDAAAQLVAHRHIVACPRCQEEITLLGDIDAMPLAPTPGALRRLVEALFQPTLGQSQPARGELLRYETPQVLINLSVRRAPGRPRTWTLRGQVRTPDGRRMRGQIEAVLLRQLDAPDQDEQPGTIETSGSFVFRGLLAGNYRLRLLTAEEEIIIRRIVVGDEL